MTTRLNRRPAGFALLIVLWSLSLLALLAMGLTSSGRSDVQLAANIRRAAAAQAAADGGVAAAVFHLSATLGLAWPSDGAEQQVTIGSYAVTVTARDESRKVNPTLASPELMQHLLAGCGADPVRSQSIALAILAWHQPGSREATTAAYRAANLRAAPTGQPFSSVGEVGLVMGMTPELLACLRPHLSVYADGSLNFPQADPMVRAALLAASGGVPPPAPTRPNVIEITATAQAAEGSRFTRRAIVSLGRMRNGPPYAVLTWETLIR